MRGRATAARVARALRRRGGDFTLMVSSPLVRALQTAEIVAAGVGYGGRLVVSETLVPEGRVSRTMAGLERFPALRKGEAARLRLPEGPGHPGEVRWRIDPETGDRETP